MLKICDNIMNNPSQIQKYGNLHARKINDKLQKCKPAMNLLYIAGFKKLNNNTRLVWTNTNNNIKSLINIHQTLQSILNKGTMTSNCDTKKGTDTMRQSETFHELISLGFTKEEASKAICISNDVDLSKYAQSSNEVSTEMVSFSLFLFFESC